MHATPHRRVAVPSAWFWGLAILCTLAGTAAAQLLSSSPPAALALSGGVVLTLCGLQLASRRGMPPLHWLTFTAIAVFGSVAVRGADDVGLPYFVIALGVGAGLAVWLGVWRATEGSALPGSVDTRRREACYWGAVLLALTLGSALADWGRADGRLGYSATLLLAALLTAAPMLLRRVTGVAPATVLWATLAAARALAAAAADWMVNGVGWTPETVGIAAAAAAAVIVFALRWHDHSPAGRHVHHPAHAAWARPS
ncbi:hypothetical protein P0W64_17270 [Tsukamurella sp. 8F]|uniref:hypothetical protein n=1 Tax=unclassified Tsukamurella TaxID=2633480 RepID=UPI0023B8F4D0|nr:MULTISPECIES: hypothetical protein [unclassified Tsukamurella]MDF0531329.1 hypothetical protein [Tsukamurella sp. 8J]MDF0588535.1 hypothetical protein [Tsukamurella sp. 8F]